MISITCYFCFCANFRHTFLLQIISSHLKSQDFSQIYLRIYREDMLILKKKKTNLIPNHGGWKVKVVQSCLTLCDPIDYTVHGILQTIILEWVAFPSQGDLPNTGIKLSSPISQADSLPAEPQAKPKNIRVGSLSL